MHIHPNNSLVLATLGAGREEVEGEIRELQAKRAAELRRKLSSVSRVLEESEEFSGYGMRVERRAYGGGARQGDDGSFGTLFSAKA